MTPSRYAAANLLLNFGIARTPKRLADAAAETALLREAEEVLGYLTWNNVKDIDELSNSYWRIHEINEQYTELFKRLTKIEERLNHTATTRVGILSSVTERTNPLRQKRDKYMHEAEELSIKREKIIENARRIRGAYEGRQTQLKVLISQAGEDSQEVQETRQDISTLRSQFEALKNTRIDIAHRMDDLDRSITELNEQIESEASGVKEEASNTNQSLGQLNREASNHKAVVGQLDKERNKLYMKIGNHLSRHYHEDEHCRKAAASEKSLTKKVLSLRDSIILNNRLSEKAQGSIT